MKGMQCSTCIAFTRPACDLGSLSLSARSVNRQRISKHFDLSTGLLHVTARCSSYLWCHCLGDHASDVERLLMLAAMWLPRWFGTTYLG